MRFHLLFACFIIQFCSVASADESDPADLSQPTIELFTQYCVTCHGDSDPDGDFRIASILSDHRISQATLSRVNRVIRNKRMPPAESDQLSPEERKRVLEWLYQKSLTQFPFEVPIRRLNRREFSSSLRDLIGVPIDFAAAMPDDGRVDGFDTGSSALLDAADSVANWLEMTRRATDSIRFLEPAKDSRISVDFREYGFTDFRKFVDQRWGMLGVFTKSKRLSSRKGEGVYLPTQWTGDRGNSFLAVPAPKNRNAALRLSLRVAAKRPFPDLPTPSLWVSIGDKYIDQVRVGEFPENYEYVIRMEDHVVQDGVIKVMLRSFVEVPYAVNGFENDDRSKPEDDLPGGIGIYRPKFDRKRLRDPREQPVPSIVVETIEIDYDYRACWPPEQVSIEQVATENSPNESSQEVYAKQLLTLWMTRAWRREVSPSEQDRYLSLYQQLRAQGVSFDDALRATFRSVLMSGSFRYLSSPSVDDQRDRQFAIASRLSFMLTGRPPDDSLRWSAANGRLTSTKELLSHVDRLIDSKEFDGFIRPFATQWLQLSQPITVAMAHLKQQEFRFSRNLKQSMRDESILYLGALIQENRPIKDLVDSDWTLVNDILAHHYGLNGVRGGEFRKHVHASGRTDQRGGGIFSHAGIQSMLCWMGDNWVIYRGAWALDRILDDPPPPPPLEVPELNLNDAEHQGLSFRDSLRIHQSDPNCSVCHAKMDPLGFAFQNFDLSGRWRDLEHARYERNEIDGKIQWSGRGPTREVDAKGVLPRGESFDGFQEFKRQLARHYRNDIARCYLKKLVLYGTGRSTTVADEIEIEQILDRTAESGYPMRDLLKEFICSPIFLGKSP